MDKQVHVISLPKTEVNDNNATIVEWLIEDNSHIEVGDKICTIETSKSVLDIESSHSGYILHIADIGIEVDVNEPLAIIGKDLDILKDKYTELSRIITETVSNTSVNATKKALALAKENKILLTELKLNRIIKEDDVIQLINSKNKADNDSHNGKIITEVIQMRGNLKVGKQLMLESVNTIPASYAEMFLSVEYAEKKIKRHTKISGEGITLLSVLAISLAKSLVDMPIFNSYRDSDEIRIYKNINISVVINHDSKIYLPTISDLDQRSPIDFVSELLRIYMNIIKNNNDLNDFKPGTFTVSSMQDTNITRFIPIIHPQQCAVLAIPRTINHYDIVRNNEDTFELNKYINLGLSFDHTYLDAKMVDNFFDVFTGHFNDILNNI